MEPFLLALLAHGVIGGADVVLNHELIAKIPSRPNAGLEEALHSGRELVFGVLFLALAWFEWRGAAALFIAALLLVELLISCVDTVIEFDTRILPVPERILHYFLFTNMGIVLTLVGQALLAWWQQPTQVLRTDHGMPGIILSVLALIALGWCVRDGLNVLQRRRARTAPTAAQTQKA